MSGVKPSGEYRIDLCRDVQYFVSAAALFPPNSKPGSAREVSRGHSQRRITVFRCARIPPAGRGRPWRTRPRSGCTSTVISRCDGRPIHCRSRCVGALCTERCTPRTAAGSPDFGYPCELGRHAIVVPGAAHPLRSLPRMELVLGVRWLMLLNWCCMLQFYEKGHSKRVCQDIPADPWEMGLREVVPPTPPMKRTSMLPLLSIRIT